MEDNKATLWKCTIRESVKIIGIFVLAVVVTSFGFPGRLQDLEGAVLRSETTLMEHAQRLRAVEDTVREQVYINRKTDIKLERIDMNIGLIIEILREDGGVRIMNP